MAKKKKVPKSIRRNGTPVLGQVILELAVWTFDVDPTSIEYHAEQLSKALQLNYGMQNFGVGSFGLKEDE
jgi:hypothetical protein